MLATRSTPLVSVSKSLLKKPKVARSSAPAKSAASTTPAASKALSILLVSPSAASTTPSPLASAVICMAARVTPRRWPAATRRPRKSCCSEMAMRSSTTMLK